MRKFRIALPFLALLALSAASDAQITEKKGGYLIQIKYRKGQVIRQNISMIAAGNSKLATNTQIITKCLDVDKNGIATLEVTTPTQPGKPPSVRKTKVDRFGRPMGNTIDGFSSNFMWPDRPLKVGESWKGDLNMAKTGQGNGMMKAKYKFVGIRSDKGTKIAVIAAYMDVTGQYDVAGTGTINIRVADGQIHSATFNMGMSQYNEGGKPTVLKLVMTIRTML